MIKQLLLLASTLLFLSCDTNPFSSETTTSGNTAGDTEKETGSTISSLYGKWEAESRVRKYYNNMLLLKELKETSNDELFLEIDSLSFDSYIFSPSDSSLEQFSTQYTTSGNSITLDEPTIEFDVESTMTFNIENSTLTITETYSYTNAVSVEGIGSSIFKIEDVIILVSYDGKLPKSEWK